MLHGVIYFKRDYLSGPDLITGGPLKSESFLLLLEEEAVRDSKHKKDCPCHCGLENGGGTCQGIQVTYRIRKQFLANSQKGNRDFSLTVTRN